MSIIYEPKGRAKEYSLLAANLYTGCSHGCLYCYAPGVLRMDKEKFHTEVAARKDVVKQIEKEAAALACTDRRVLLCFTCDPYQPLDDELQLTRQVLQILKKHRVPFQILTKGGMRAARDFDLYEKWDAFATTMTFMQPTFMQPCYSEIWEPRAALPDERVSAIKIAKEAGIQTWVSLEPVIDIWESLKIISQTHDFVDHYKIGKLNYIEPPVPVDWRRFGKEAITLCEFYGKSYYIKQDLAKYLSGVGFRNTDTRKVN